MGSTMAGTKVILNAFAIDDGFIDSCRSSCERH
jgi:hypothetical protein